MIGTFLLDTLIESPLEGYNDGSNGIAPVVFTFPAHAQTTLTFPSVGGAWTCGSGNPDYGADGETSGACAAVDPINLPSIRPPFGLQRNGLRGRADG